MGPLFTREWQFQVDRVYEVPCKTGILHNSFSDRSTLTINIDPLNIPQPIFRGSYYKTFKFSRQGPSLLLGRCHRSRCIGKTWKHILHRSGIQSFKKKWSFYWYIVLWKCQKINISKITYWNSGSRTKDVSRPRDSVNMNRTSYLYLDKLCIEFHKNYVPFERILCNRYLITSVHSHRCNCS